METSDIAEMVSEYRVRELEELFETDKAKTSVREMFYKGGSSCPTSYKGVDRHGPKTGVKVLHVDGEHVLAVSPDKLAHVGPFGDPIPVGHVTYGVFSFDPSGNPRFYKAANMNSPETAYHKDWTKRDMRGIHGYSAVAGERVSADAAKKGIRAGDLIVSLRQDYDKFSESLHLSLKGKVKPEAHDRLNEKVKADLKMECPQAYEDLDFAIEFERLKAVDGSVSSEVQQGMRELKERWGIKRTNRNISGIIQDAICNMSRWRYLQMSKTDEFKAEVENEKETEAARGMSEIDAAYAPLALGVGDYTVVMSEAVGPEETDSFIGRSHSSPYSYDEYTGFAARRPKVVCNITHNTGLHDVVEFELPFAGRYRVELMKLLM